jgi:hypothetical protein
MQYHGLVQCDYGHIKLMTVDGFIRKDYYNRKEIESRTSCGECLSSKYPSRTNRFFLISETNPIYILKRIPVLSNNNPLFKAVFNSYGFIAETEKNYFEVFISPEKYVAVFMGSSHKKVRDLYIIAPEKHKIFKEFDTANKADKRNIKAATPPKPKIVLPETLRDAVGTDIKIGDWVAFSSMNYTALRFGKIIKLNPSSVTIKIKGGGRVTSGKSTDQIIKIPDERAMLFMLEH